MKSGMNLSILARAVGATFRARTPCDLTATAPMGYVWVATGEPLLQVDADAWDTVADVRRRMADAIRQGVVPGE
jgi:hypothetical protein